MSRKRTSIPPSDVEVLSQSNVPVEMAARYIGWSTTTICYALQEGRAPFGFSSKNPNTGTYTYNISPGLLIKYKNGDLPTYRLEEVINLAADGVERVIEMKLSGLQKIIGLAVSP